jgi:hypothetical protein
VSPPSPSPQSKSSAKGSYYKGRTKKWLVADGWAVADMELYRRIGPNFGVKSDQFGADLMAMRHTPSSRLAFIQVKGGQQPQWQVRAAVREFLQHPFPEFVELWVVCWPKRARQPRVWTVAPGEDPMTADEVENVLEASA